MYWNGVTGKAAFFYDGDRASSIKQNESLKGELPSGKNFKIGIDNNPGTLTQLNIWNYELPEVSFKAMSAGGVNVHGNMLSWSDLSRYVTENKNRSSEIFLPGEKTSNESTSFTSRYSFSIITR